MILLMEDIGEVTFRKNQRSKYLRIIIKPNEGVKVSLPYSVSYNSAISFVNSKKAWIKKSMGKIKELEGNTVFYNEDTPMTTKYHTLKVMGHKRNDFQVFCKNGICYIYYPGEMDVNSKKVQDMIKSGIIWLLRKEARSYLPFRVMHLAEKHNLKHARVTVKNIKTRWGSCSHNNNINLNIHLMRLPDHLIDYVILHELAHTVHKNHSKAFWDFLDTLCGNSKNMRKEMKKYTTAL